MKASIDDNARRIATLEQARDRIERLITNLDAELSARIKAAEDLHAADIAALKNRDAELAQDHKDDAAALAALESTLAKANAAHKAARATLQKRFDKQVAALEAVDRQLQEADTDATNARGELEQTLRNEFSAALASLKMAHAAV